MAQNGTRLSGPRCIALVGPFQSGKTTLLEAILARTFKIWPRWWGAVSRRRDRKGGAGSLRASKSNLNGGG